MNGLYSPLLQQNTLNSFCTSSWNEVPCKSNTNMHQGEYETFLRMRYFKCMYANVLPGVIQGSENYLKLISSSSLFRNSTMLTLWGAGISDWTATEWMPLISASLFPLSLELLPSFHTWDTNHLHTISLMQDLRRSRSSLVRPAWFTSLFARVTNRLEINKMKYFRLFFGNLIHTSNEQSFQREHKKT